MIPIYIPSWLVPASLGWIGSLCLGLALLLVLVDMPGGVNWSRIGAGFALVGGFGALGGVAGWLGEQVLWGQQHAMSWLQEWGGRLVGGSITLVILLGLLVFAWKALAGTGIATKGKKPVSKRVRSLVKAFALAMVGATAAILISPLYTLLDEGVRNLHSVIV